MAVGLVGAADELISGDEAFETADDEVGIYKVRQVDVDPIEIPEPADADHAATATEADEQTAEAHTEPPDSTSEPDEPDTDQPDEGSAPETGDEPASADDASDGPASAQDSPSEAPPGAVDAREPTDASGSADREADGPTRTAGSADDPDAAGSDRGATPSRDDRPTGRSQPGSSRQAGASPTDAGRGRTDSDAVDLETRSIPSLDPDRTTQPRQERATTVEPEPTRTPDPEPASAPDPDPARGAAQPESGDSSAVEDLEDELAEKEAEIDELEAALSDAEAARADLEAELETVREERDELADRVDELQSELSRLEEEMGAATDAERRLTPSEAIEGTNLFVDYDSKGAATLAKAHDGAEGRADVAENLQLGVHTEFADGGVAVSGQDFHEWLRSTLHYRFAEWVVSTLLFEVRDTGHANDLVDLYDAIPEIRRVEFNGSVDVEYVEDGQEKGGREHFDVIFRHRMGDPLVVANLNESRDPATGGMMETLVTSAERVGQTADSLSTAMLVTSSFFESAALETVGEATRGGILSRDKRTSFVNLSRKTGYHLCLVAAREGNFHMEVPEL
jgi:flagellin-like hook-associated protein FlgL